MTEQTSPTPTGPVIDRRTTLAGLVVGGAVGGLALAAGCSSDSVVPTIRSASGDVLVPLEDVPVGEAVLVRTERGRVVAVARPSENEAVGFSTTCTHLGCTVTPEGHELTCPCHGSVFSATTGEVLQGPAAQPLGRFEVEVVDGQVRSA